MPRGQDEFMMEFVSFEIILGETCAGACEKLLSGAEGCRQLQQSGFAALLACYY